MATQPPPRGSSLSSVPDRVLSPSRQQDAAARRAARREQMQNYYGLSPAPVTPRSGGTTPNTPASAPLDPNPTATGLSPAPGPSSSSSAVPHTPRTPRTPGATDFSSPHFVPAAYYEDLISRASLPELLKTTSTLATDVGRLHSSRHTLVYNHHHQLFSAGDTIATLNARTPQLLSIVTELQERFSLMSQLADSVALPEPRGADEGDRLRSAVGRGVERVRLMVVAEEPAEGVRKVWEGVEAMSSGREVEGVQKLLEEGRELVAVRAAMEAEAA